MTAISSTVERDLRRETVRRMLWGAAWLAGLWMLFYVLWQALPFIRPGHNQIYDTKLAMLETGHLFRDDGDVRLVVFGNSQIMAGFKPERFREWSEGRVESFNLGLPDAGHFLAELETLVDRGSPPTHVFLTISWPLREGTGREQNVDKRWMERLFPFRRLMRDVALFLVRSASRGGPVAYYEHGRELLARMEIDSGYYFSEEQSHHAGHRLPDVFPLDTDTPDQPVPRGVVTRGTEFERMLALRERGSFRLAFVPIYQRSGAVAPAAPNDDARRRLAEFDIEMIGPDYWMFPNRLFSDPVHMNRPGAECYSARLWNLTRAYLLDGTGRIDPSSQPSAAELCGPMPDGT